MILKVKNSLLKLEKDFKPVYISIDDMDKFKEKEITKKKTFARNTWCNSYDKLINYISELIKNGGWF